ncbi:MAG: hypothetical protein AAB550_03065 [Patescibacteria group bacterium]
MAGFNKQQKQELKEIMGETLHEFFDDMVKPAFELVHEQLGEMDKVIKDIDSNMVEKPEFTKLRKRVGDIEDRLVVAGM